MTTDSQHPADVGGGFSTRWLAAVCILLTGISLASPVWLSVILPTGDGASHTYNAMVANQVRQGDSSFANWFAVRPLLRSNFATDHALGLAGPMLGWEGAERLWISIIIVAQLLVYFHLLRHSLSLELATTVAAWLATNWFVWMGFYDFSLSLAVFAALAATLRHWTGRFLLLRIELLLLALYATHLYAFLIGTVLFIWILLWRAVCRQIRAIALVAALLPVGLLAFELLAGPVSHGSVSWSGWSGLGKAILGWGIGDALITFTGLGVLSGILLMLATWMGLWQRVRTARLLRWDPLDIFAIAACILSIVIPDKMGRGSYTSARLRFMAVLAILPATSAFLSQAHPRIRRWLAFLPVTLALALVLQAAWIVWLSQDLGSRVTAMVQTLEAAGVGAGDWVAATFENRREKILRITVYSNLPARAYLRVKAADAEDFEPFAATFELTWKQHPEILDFHPNGGHTEVIRSGNGVRGVTVSVLHDSRSPLVSRSPGLQVERSVSHGALSVTRVYQPGSGPPGRPLVQ